MKTPLASLWLFVKMDESPLVEQEISQIEWMEMLIGSLLRLEKLCADGHEFSFSGHNVWLLIENVWNRLVPMWPEKQILIEGEAVIRCDEKWLSEAFQNLQKNACEHTATNGNITIILE